MKIMKDTLSHRLLLLFQKIQETAKVDFRDRDITRGNCVTLCFIYENPGITQAELAELNHKDRNVIGKVIDKLEEKQYVQRVRGKKDRRSFSLYLTETGEKVCHEYWDLLTKGETEIRKRLTPEEQQSFDAILDKLIDL